MPVDRPSAPRRARLRARLLACLRAERGDTMIEVTIAALLVALIAVATFTAYSAIAHVAGGQNTRAEATALAEADQARMHGLTLVSLAGTGGNVTTTKTVGTTTFTISSSTQFVSGATGTASCTTNSTSTADEVQTTSTVTWATEATAGGPVEIHGLVTPPEGGALIVRIVDGSGNPISGASVSLSGGSTSTSPLTTDSNGCVEFAGLSGGTYTVSTNAGGTTTTATAPTVVPTQTSNLTLTPGGDGGISATFTTTYNGSSHASSADQVVAWNSVYPSVYNVFGSASTLSDNTYASTVNSGSVYGPGTYTTYAGACPGDYSAAGSKQVSVTSNTTTSVSLPLPAMIVDVYGNPTTTEVDDAPSSSVVYTGSHWTHASTGSSNYNSTESYDSTAGDYVTYTFTGTSVEWIAPLASNGGYADVYIDGTKISSNVSTYSSSTSYQQVIWSDSGLSNTSHTIKIYVDGTKPSGSSSTSIAVDAFVASGAQTYVDDESSSLTYTGSWTHATGYSSDYDSDESYSNTTNNSMTMTFTGTSVAWLSSYASNHGIAYVYLDGTEVATVDTYAASSLTQQTMWSTTGLTNTTHTLQIVVSGTKNTASSGYYVSVDAIVLGTVGPSLLTTAPVVTITDTNSGCSGENYPATQAPTATQGALVDPGQPYGNYTVCASSGGVENTATVANTSYTAGNVVNVYLGTGSSGLTSGSCT
jgi:hypothetical protein